MLALNDLVSLREDLKKTKKVIYFHENQMVYPNRVAKDRDFQFIWNQIMSGLVADTILFNSYFNMNSFIQNIPSALKLIPFHKLYNTTSLLQTISLKSSVLYFPLILSVPSENSNHHH